MGKETAISWTDSTFNPWWGCTPISPGCAHCYAATLDHRTGGDCFGAGKTRRTFGEKHWNQPLNWDKSAEKEGKLRLVFVASMADVFDAEAPAGELEKLWDVIRKTPHLIWQILTKRSDRIAMSLPTDWGQGYPNVWLGVTAENQEMADARIPLLLQVPAAKRFLSCEPLIGPVDFNHCSAWNPVENNLYLEAIDWVIAGGETGHGARPMHPDWARSLRDQCQAAGVPFFFKQWGEWGLRNAFESFTTWCNKAPTWLDKSDVCMDTAGRICRIGKDFQTARDEGKFPVAFGPHVGKKDAGRELDGREWSEMPEGVTR